MNWIDFGQSPSDSTTVKIVRQDGHPWSEDVRVLPRHHGISPSVNGTVLSFTVTGQHKYLMLRFGDQLSHCDNRTSFKNSIFIFITAPDVTMTNTSNLTHWVFTPGVYLIPGDGVLQLPDSVDTVVVMRGAWVQGRINVTRSSSQPRNALRVIGHGVLDGSRFRYHGGKEEDSMRLVEMPYDLPLIWDGVTLLHPQGHALFAPPNSLINDFKMMGWLFNEDGIWIGPNSTLKNAFIRTNDDAIRVYAGAWDNYHRQIRPPRHSPTKNVTVRDVVVYQSFNGAVFQLGWESGYA